MRTHRQIIQEHGASRLRSELGDRGVQLSATAPQRWADRNSIPGEYWRAIADLDIASLEELAAAAAASAAAKRGVRPDATQDAA
jgi:hypothetical protein